MRGRADRLFHTLIVVGASLSGCGGRANGDGGVRPDTSGGTGNSAGSSAFGGAVSPGGAAAGGTASLSPTDCAQLPQFRCDDYTALTNCTCDTSAPISRTDCADPLEFNCVALTWPPAGAGTGGGLNFAATYYVGCTCKPPPLRPEDCASPDIFFCNRTYPDFADCSCDPSRLCETSQNTCCQSVVPRFGCGCCPVIIK